MFNVDKVHVKKMVFIYNIFFEGTSLLRTGSADSSNHTQDHHNKQFVMAATVLSG